MKEFWGTQRMATDEEVKQTATDWLNGLVADFYDEGIDIDMSESKWGLCQEISTCCIQQYH
jgi:hypothetical protein